MRMSHQLGDDNNKEEKRREEGKKDMIDWTCLSVDNKKEKKIFTE
jgi:hypothetical protein